MSIKGIDNASGVGNGLTVRGLGSEGLMDIKSNGGGAFYLS